jgi:hypothetical protein
MNSIFFAVPLVVGFAILGCAETNPNSLTTRSSGDPERNCWLDRSLPDNVESDAGYQDPTSSDESPSVIEEQDAQDSEIGFVPPVAGKIKSIGGKDSRVVQLDIGSRQGIAVDDLLSVQRDGNNDFGLLVVTSIQANECEAKVSFVQQGELVPEDQVIKDTTIAISNTLLTNAVLDPMALAKLHAESDQKLGIERVLFYGKGAFRGVARFDEESGLRMQMNGGCVVSREFLEFTEEYNRLMRQAASSLTKTNMAHGAPMRWPKS